MSGKKVILGLSGGVDSAVAAVLLEKAGYEVHAVYIMCWQEPGCRAEEDRKDAMKVALQLDLPFQVLDFRKEYQDKVLAYFFREYEAGRTPNPDVVCNRDIKFGLFYDWAMKQGYDFVATGHYCRVMPGFSSSSSSSWPMANIGDPSDTSDQAIPNLDSFHGSPMSTFSRLEDDANKKRSQVEDDVKRKYCLLTAKELRKDQSYFLYQIRQEQLDHILFPIGKYLKSEVREMAREYKIPVAEKKDSMGICFVGQVNVHSFLKERLGVKKGFVTLKDGTVVGEHEGHWFFTIGRRGGWTMSGQRKVDSGKFKKSELPPLYVIKINKDENKVIVGTKEDGMIRKFEVSELTWLVQNPESTFSSLYVKIRNTGKWVPCKLTNLGEDKVEVNLEELEFGVSPGQHAVFYRKIKEEEYKVVGGGVIKG